MSIRAKTEKPGFVLGSKITPNVVTGAFVEKLRTFGASEKSLRAVTSAEAKPASDQDRKREKAPA